MTTLLNPSRSIEPFDWRKHYTPRSAFRNPSPYGFGPDLSRSINLETYPGGGTPYGLAALEQECARIQRASEGERNTTLFSSATRVAGLAAGGELDNQLAVEQVAMAAARTNLDGEEILRTIARPDGAFHRGGLTPRNRDGFLGVQYSGAVLKREFSLERIYTGPLEPWLSALNADEPGLAVHHLISRFEELGILYLSTFYFFLAQLVRLVEQEEFGTAIAYHRLVRQFGDQAVADEKKPLEDQFMLRQILGAIPSEYLKEHGEFVDLGYLLDKGFPPEEAFGSSAQGSESN
jgi:hypothetical protein